MKRIGLALLLAVSLAGAVPTPVKFRNPNPIEAFEMLYPEIIEGPQIIVVDDEPAPELQIRWKQWPNFA